MLFNEMKIPGKLCFQFAWDFHWETGRPRMTTLRELALMSA